MNVSRFLSLLFLLSQVFYGLAQTNYTKFVNPMIGTGGHGHTFPGAVVPFGMVQLSPDTRVDGSWDGCSGYHHSDNAIYGFSHTHLSGTGCSDYGDIAMLPFDAKKHKQDNAFNWLDLKQLFSHKNETALAGYYQVKLNNNINCEFTAGKRFGMHKYTFPKKTKAGIVLKLTHRDKTIASDLTVIDPYHVQGYRRSEAWAKDQYIYFVIEFSSPLTRQQGQGFGNSTGANGIDYETYTFENLGGKPLLVKVGISNVSIEGAQKNLDSEITDWNFDRVKKEAAEAWNKELSKIEVDVNNVEKATIFYTALYHCMIHPSLASDADGKYRGRDNAIHEAQGFSYYSVFSLWDTFRGLHPLLSIIDQKRTSDFIKTFLAQYQNGALLPVWELSSNETDCMIGYHAVSVIADAYTKGIDDFDVALAIEAAKKSAENWGYRGLQHYHLNGFLAIDDESESVSKTLEYAYDDWCIATMIEKYASQNDYTVNIDRKQLLGNYPERAASWRNLFDAQTNFIRPRANGSWLNPFEPREVNNNFTEANAWQYTFFAPQDVNTLIDYVGGPENFEKKLDELFSTSTETTGRTQADITGLIGQYAHGNEPSHHMTYLYNYVGAPHKAQEKIHFIKTSFYNNAPDGLIGNEDCGQMSAWYVLSAMGFYPVCPGDTKYILGTPSFEKTRIHLENGKTFTLASKNYAESNYYCSNTKLYLEHTQIMNGETFTFELNATPSLTNKKDLIVPTNKIDLPGFTPVPYFTQTTKTFKSDKIVEIKNNSSAIIEYTSDNPFCNYDTCQTRIKTYTGPIVVKESCTLYARNRDKNNNVSKWVKQELFKINHNFSITLLSTYNPQYTAGGDNGLIDGLCGDTDWRKGGWQGYQNQDFECVVDLQKTTPVKTINASFLQDTRAWIFYPSQVEFYVSTDGVTYTPFGNHSTNVLPVTTSQEEPSLKQVGSNATQQQEARYVKVKAKNIGRLPSWHQGYGMQGDNAFIFIGEITIH